MILKPHNLLEAIASISDAALEAWERQRTLDDPHLAKLEEDVRACKDRAR